MTQSSSDFSSSDEPEKLSTESSVYSNLEPSFFEARYHISFFKEHSNHRKKTTTGFSFVPWSLLMLKLLNAALNAGIKANKKLNLSR